MLFNRKVKVKIGPPGSEQGIGLDGLRINFEVKKSIKNDNTATISITNLSESTRNKINEIDDIIILEAGYEDDTDRTVFIGNISRIVKPRQGADIVTTVEANDGGKIKRENITSKSYKKGMPVFDIFEDLISEFGLPSKIESRLRVKLQQERSEFTNGYSHIGQTKEALDKVAKKLGIEWTIQNDTVKVVEKGKTDNDQTRSVLLSENSGLIGYPIRKDDIENGSNKEERKKGWEVKSLLRPIIEPAGIITLDTKLLDNVKTQFRVETVTHKGDNWGNDFYSFSTVSEIKV